MNDRQLMQQTLELEKLADRFSEGWHDGIKIDASDVMLLTDVAAFLRKRLSESVAQPEPVQEPVAKVAEVHMSRYTIEWTNGPLPEGTNLYARPAERKFEDKPLTQAREPLTDEEKHILAARYDVGVDVISAIAAHGIKGGA